MLLGVTFEIGISQVAECFAVSRLTALLKRIDAFLDPDAMFPSGVPGLHQCEVRTEPTQDHQPLAAAFPVTQDERLLARWIDADAETGHLVIPADIPSTAILKFGYVGLPERHEFNQVTTCVTYK